MFFISRFLGNGFYKNISWNALGMVISQASNIILMLILARILLPEDFGEYSIILAIIMMGQVFNELGISSYIIHKKELKKGELDTLFYINIIISILIFTILIAASNKIAYYFNINNSFELKFSCLIILFMGFGNLNRALIEKNKEFKTIALIDSFATLLGFISAVIYVYYVGGLFTLVLNYAVKVMVQNLCYYRFSNFRFGFSFNIKYVRVMLNFTSFLMINNIFGFFTKSLDKAIISKSIGNIGLGIYTLSNQVLISPILAISNMFVKVLYPTLTQLKHDGMMIDFESRYLKTIRIIAIITSIPLMFIFFHSEQFTLIFLGEKWIKYSYIFKYLAPLGIMQVIFTTMGCLYLVSGKTKIGMLLQLSITFLTLVSIYIGCSWGIHGVIFAILIINIIFFIPSTLIPCLLVGVNYKNFLISVFIPWGIGLFLNVIFLFLINSSELIFNNKVLFFVIGPLFYIIVLCVLMANNKLKRIVFSWFL
ncbi:TPA: oligosaccharide flippase family protein [Photobacterium damselae]